MTKGHGDALLLGQEASATGGTDLALSPGCLSSSPLNLPLNAFIFTSMAQD